jgi:hypothetical protein
VTFDHNYFVFADCHTLDLVIHNQKNVEQEDANGKEYKGGKKMCVGFKLEKENSCQK